MSGSKKFLMYSLIVVGNAAVVFLMAVVNLMLFFMTINLAMTIMVGLSALAALGFAASRVFRVLKRKNGIKFRQFITAAFVPSAVGAAVYWIVYAILDASGYFRGWFAGLGEGIFGIALAPTACVYLVLGIIWCIVESNRALA